MIEDSAAKPRELRTQSDNSDILNTEGCLLYVIDDDLPTLELYQKVLAMNAREMIVKTFTTPLKALEEMEEMEPDLIICDVMMPEMNGKDFVKHITNIEKYRSIPVILITAGRYDMAFKRECLDRGAIDFLTKPVDLDDLTCRIRSLLRFRLLARNLARTNHEIQEMQKIIMEQEKLKTLNTIIVTLNHEINNPLTSLIGNMELYLADPPTEGLDEIQEAYEAALKIRDIVMKITKVRLSDKVTYLNDVEMFDLNKVGVDES